MFDDGRLSHVAELPSGTVTFLFTDIEGSTRLLHALGQHRYDVLLTTHREILEAAFTVHGGRVVDTQGDSFFVAFRTANDAVASAVDAQRDLVAHGWPEGAQVKVRMGLHTGEPKVGQERYVGIGVHRAARIGAAGHGGQVLLSWTTKGLAEEDLPPGVTIRDMGERRLKDIEQPQRLYQLVIEGLDSEFAPLRTLDVELARKRRRMYAGAALIGVLAAAVAIPVFAFGQGGGSGGGLTVEGNAVAEIDPGSNKVVGQVPNVGARPGSIASGSGSLWVANLDDQTVARIDPSTRSVERTIPVQDPPTGLAASPGAVWVVGSNVGSSSVAVRRIDPQFATVSNRTSVGNVVPGGPGFVAARGGTVWVAPSSGLLSRLDATDARVVGRIDPNSGPAAVALGAEAVWVTDSEANTVTRIDPTGLLTPIPVGRGPGGIAVGAGGVWVTDALDDAVVRIDPVTRAVTTTIPVGRAPAGIAVGDGSVWVANSGDGTVTRIDPSNPGATTTIPVGGSPQGVAVEGGRVWVTVAMQTIAARPGRSSGGVARVNAQFDVDYMDPALAFLPNSWQLLYATCAKLLNYPDKPAPEGSRVIPEVARSLPSRSADGKTYTFAIRKGFRFSPPSNQSVTARTFKYSIERSLSPKMKSRAQGFFADIVGAKAYMAGKAAHIAGIVARGDTLTIHLVAPAPDLVTRLAALPFVCSVPIGTPLDPKGVRTVPSAGPYYVSLYTPGQGVVLTRNPNYRGNRPHRLERIELTVNVTAKKTDSAIEAGSVDYNSTGVDPGNRARIAARYGPGSPAARGGRQQYFVNPTLGIDYIILNSHRPLFQDLRLRQAVNFAIDRRALARIGPQGAGPEQPTDQYLPSAMPGFKDAHVYPLTPNLATARRLARGRGGTAILYTCNQSPCDQLAQTIKTNLAAIGIDVQVKTFGISALIARLGRPAEPFDLAVGKFVAWAADYPDPGDFLNFLVGSGAGGLVPPFTDPGYQRKIRAAARLAGPPRYLTYGKLDAHVSRDYAPWVPLGNLLAHDFFSARMGCQVYNPFYGIDLAALCIKH
jgi:YVTN family beta-propeller protein